ncbi:ArdC family protein [Paracidovorax sp. MALMAid1276]|uniref:ArdC family protein n=1 Tax=Paracidovorax sp. MALMAid1276 TaxID=3411631 RepID=UPI003B9DACD3
MDEKKPRPNFTQDVTNKVIELMETEGMKPWEASWDRGLTKAFNPYTPQKGKQGREYRGANAVNLLMGQLARDSADPRWLTFNQAKQAGLSIRKGAVSEAVMFWQFPESKPKDVEWSAGTDKPAVEAVYQLKSGKYAAYGRLGWMKEADTIEAAQNARVTGSRFRGHDSYQWAPVDDLEATARVERPRPIYALVFNGADVVGMPPMKERRPFNANEHAERLIQATGAVIEHRELTRAAKGALVNRAFYDPAGDEITVPPRGHFKTPGDYYRTVIHEIAHWTGHESRLNRGVEDAKRDSPEYVWEELRAEMASAMICAALGVEGGLQDHAAYLDDYIKLLKEDRSAIFKAARDAEKIYNAVFDFDPELRAIVEGHLSDNALGAADPNAKRQQGIDLKKIIKGELPNFAPIKPAVTQQPVAEPTSTAGGGHVAWPMPAAAPVATPPPAAPEGGGVVWPMPAPVAPSPAAQAADEDVEIDFGGLRLGDEATQAVSAGAAQDQGDDEIALDGFELDVALDGQYSDIEVGGPAP